MESGLESAPGLVWVAPFALLLAAIAIVPLWKPHFWEKNSNKLIVAGGLSLPVIVLLLLRGDSGHLVHTLNEYFQFMVLLGSLFYVSGGIVLRGDIEATPAVNAAFLAFGSVIANLVGTTGASMLLIRPLLNTNSERRNVAHTVVFFIFLVSNVGGCLTPLGDPPLFLGFLRGVPFTWTLGLWKEWLFLNVLLLTIYFFLDRKMHAAETPDALVMDETQITAISLGGKLNLLFLAGIIACVAVLPEGFREAGMIMCAAFSHVATSNEIRTENNFSIGPIVEVACLFIGIFITMVPAIMILHVYGPGLGLKTPAAFFWAAGSLSSFLDNAPTYVTFFETAKTIPLAGAKLVAGVPEPFLIAISLGSVFMGANSYIGNGPNFMVKAVADAHGVRMPDFFGYMKWSGAVLIPSFLLVTWIFL